MATKTISFTLDPDSVEAAIKQVRKAQDDIIRIMGMLVKALTEKGVDIAKINIAAYEAVDTTLLFNSMAGYYNDANHVGIISNNTWYAFFVEYGTGVVGAAHGHPGLGSGEWTPPPIAYTTASGDTRVYTDYDTYGHGDAGWVYPKNGGAHWTIGMPSRPFMFDTYTRLEQEARTVARDIFHQEWR